MSESWGSQAWVSLTQDNQETQCSLISPRHLLVALLLLLLFKLKAHLPFIPLKYFVKSPHPGSAPLCLRTALSTQASAPHLTVPCPGPIAHVPYTLALGPLAIRNPACTLKAAVWVLRVEASAPGSWGSLNCRFGPPTCPRQGPSHPWGPL